MAILQTFYFIFKLSDDILCLLFVNNFHFDYFRLKLLDLRVILAKPWLLLSESTLRFLETWLPSALWSESSLRFLVTWFLSALLTTFLQQVTLDWRVDIRSWRQKSLLDLLKPWWHNLHHWAWGVTSTSTLMILWLALVIRICIQAPGFFHFND